MNELKKARRFGKGLKPELYHQIAVLTLPTYQAVLEKAQLVKTFHRKSIEHARGFSSFKRFMSMPIQPDKRQRTVQILVTTQGVDVRNLSCPYCGKNHCDHPCVMFSCGCYKCNSMQHSVQDCPEPREPQRPMTYDRVYNITTHDAKATPQLI